jgi:hypothetical protein
MNPNPLSDREKALENQWIKEKESVLDLLLLYLSVTTETDRVQKAAGEGQSDEEAAASQGHRPGDREQGAAAAAADGPGA